MQGPGPHAKARFYELVTGASTYAATPARWNNPLIWAPIAALIGVAAIWTQHGGSTVTSKLILASIPGVAVSLLVLARPYFGAFTLCLTFQQIWTHKPILLTFTFVDIITVLTIVGFLVADHKPTRRRGTGLPLESLGLRIALLLGIAVVLSLFYRESPSANWAGAKRVIGYLVMVFLVVRVTTTAKQVRGLVLALVLSGIASTGTSVLDYTFGLKLGGQQGGRQFDETDARFYGTGGEAGTAAKLMVVSTTLAALYALRRKKGWRLLAAAIALMGVFGILTTGTRMALLVIFFAGLWLAWKARHSPHFGKGVVLAFVVLSVTVSQLPTRTWDRLERLRNPEQDTTATLRTTQLRIAAKEIRENPVLGVGPKGFPALFISHEYRWMPGHIKVAMQMHNAYLAVGVENGTIAMLLLLGLIGTAWRSARKARWRAQHPETRLLAEAVEFTLICFMITALSGPTHRQMAFWMVIALGLCMDRFSYPETSEEGFEPPLTDSRALEVARSPQASEMALPQSTRR